MALKGRGLRYSRTRAIAEAVLGWAFAGDWPARQPFAHTSVRAVRSERRGVPLAGRSELRIGFVSDLHAGPTTSMRTLEEAFAHLRGFRPDLLLLGGDYVLFDARYAEWLVPLIRSVEAPLGRFAVMGNHDLWADDRLVTEALCAGGARVLVNELVHFDQVPTLSLGGLDDAWTGRPHYPAAFEGRRDWHLLLMHSPDHAPFLDGYRWDLALCGHTHGGHVALPGGRPIVVPTPESRNYLAGPFTLDGGELIVSRGVGNPEVPFRLFAPPDVQLVTLRAER